MHRIDHATRAQDLFGTGKDGFTEGQPSPPIAATVVTSAWANDVQESIATAVEEARLTLVKGKADQLAMAIESLSNRHAPAVNFELVAAASSAHRPMCVASNADGSVLVSVGHGNSDTANCIAYSNDGGRTWTNVASHPTVGNVYSLRTVHFGNGLFVAVGKPSSGSTAYILTSADGVTWTGYTPAALSSSEFRRSFYHAASGKHFVVDPAGGRIWSTTTFSTLSTSLLDANILDAVIDEASGNIAVSRATSPPKYSSNGGTSWPSASLSAGSMAVNSIAFDSEVGAFIAIDGFYRWTSNDGALWTRLALPTAIAFTFKEIAAHAGVVILTKADATRRVLDGYVAVSPNFGRTWKTMRPIIFAPFGSAGPEWQSMRVIRDGSGARLYIGGSATVSTQTVLYRSMRW